jgi:4-diphosphocytidyl-2-C-methyl-D-erythritol kinase
MGARPDALAGFQRFAAPAKLNLFLHVTGRRADGYHDLQTIFRLIDLCDDVYLQATDDGAIRRDPPPTDPGLAELADADDLAVRAARLLQEDSGSSRGARIHVVKRIPSGGGLGGGSSDAATVLKGLNSLWQLGYHEDRLAALGLQLGADVPVFVRGRDAWAEGRGEQLTPVALPPCWYVVVRPPVSVPTGPLFADPQLRRDAPRVSWDDFLAGRTTNDFEPVVRRRYPAVAEALDWLGSHGAARLTGTGSCLFAPFATEVQARRAAAEAPPGLAVFVARALCAAPAEPPLPD